MEVFTSKVAIAVIMVRSSCDEEEEQDPFCWKFIQILARPPQTKIQPSKDVGWRDEKFGRQMVS